MRFGPNGSLLNCDALVRQRRIEDEFLRPYRPGDAERCIVGVARCGERCNGTHHCARQRKPPGLVGRTVRYVENNEGPKLPKMKGKSNACAAP